MSVNLISIDVPPIVPVWSLINTASPTPPSCSPPVTAGSTMDGLDAINCAIKAQDAHVQGAGGGGSYRIVRGLALSTAADLNLPVSAGQAALDGLATLPADTTLPLSPSIDRAFIWLSQFGVLSAVYNDPTPPSPWGWLFIGSCETDADSITSVDISGVPCNCGGLLYIELADLGEPAWVVPAGSAHLARTRGGLYYHDGVAGYTRLGNGITEVEGWFSVNVGASLSAVVMERFNNIGYPALYVPAAPGSIIGVWVGTNDPRTAGTATVEVWKNGAATGLQASLNGTDTTFGLAVQPQGEDVFVPGDRIDLRLTTDGSWAPTTADLVAGLKVML